MTLLVLFYVLIAVIFVCAISRALRPWVLVALYFLALAVAGVGIYLELESLS